jgi:hypothetical protein
MVECHLDGGKVWRDDTLKGCACPTGEVWDPENNNCHFVDCASINTMFAY